MSRSALHRQSPAPMALRVQRTLRNLRNHAFSAQPWRQRQQESRESCLTLCGIRIFRHHPGLWRHAAAAAAGGRGDCCAHDADQQAHRGAGRAEEGPRGRRGGCQQVLDSSAIPSKAPRRLDLNSVCSKPISGQDALTKGLVAAEDDASRPVTLAEGSRHLGHQAGGSWQGS